MIADKSEGKWQFMAYGHMLVLNSSMTYTHLEPNLKIYYYLRVKGVDGGRTSEILKQKCMLS